MNNEPKDPVEESTAQDIREQQVWERLQNEAVAAQRWRLEQEIEQARKAQDESESENARLSETSDNGLSKRLAVVALASFIIVTLIVAAVYAW
ncbi:MAG: hypothetical protein ACPGSM_13945 [Thiolinea sp.]